jgi:hypothetical protein
MRFQLDGTPVISDANEAIVADNFSQKLADALYGRLPKFVKLFLSKSKFASLIRDTIRLIASRA